MNYTQAEAWAIDRALNFIQVTERKTTTPQEVIEIAQVFAERMREAVKEGGELEEQVLEEVERRVQEELNKITTEGGVQ